MTTSRICLYPLHMKDIPVDGRDPAPARPVQNDDVRRSADRAPEPSVDRVTFADAYNAFVDRHGLLLAEFRQF